MSDTQTAPAGDDAARGEPLNTVHDAVAELERREQARRAERKAAKAEAEPEADEPEDDGRPVKRIDDVEDEPEDKPKKAKPVAEGEDEDAEEDETAEEDDADEDDEDDEDEPKKKAEPTKVKLRVEGKEVEVEPHVISEYVETVTKQGREVQQQRQQVEQARQQLQQQHQAFAQQAQALAQMAQAVIGTEPDLALAQQDPQAYLVQQGLYRQRMQMFQQLQQQAQSASQGEHARTQQQREAALAAGREALHRAMPELADPEKLAAFRGRASKVAQQYGFADEHLETVTHPGFFVMLRDLARLRDMEAAKSDAKKKLTSAPSRPMPGPQASESPRETGTRSSKAAKSEFLKSSRSMRDVQRYLSRTGG